MDFLTIISFIKNSKSIQYLIGFIVVISALFFTYKYIFNLGYNEAKDEAKIEYIKQLNDVLQKQAIKQEEAIKKATETAAKEKDIEIKWKEKKVYIDKIIEKPIYKDCKMQEEDKKAFDSAWDEIK